MKPLKTLLLSRRDVSLAIDTPAAIRVVKAAFMAYARGRAVMPPKTYLPLPGNNDFRAMPAFLQSPFSCGLKWVNVHPGNPKLGLPSVMAVILINDPKTGALLAILDGQLITKMRTAAAAAVAAKALANPGSRQVGLIGCGAQADAQIAALAHVFRLTDVGAWGYQPGEAKRFCARMQRLFPAIRFKPESSVEACAKTCDILVTLTPSRKPLVKRAWVQPGVHINAVGADGPGKQELDPAILREARVVVDDPVQAIHGGELNVPVKRRQYNPKRIHASLGEVLLGEKTGRRSRHEITVFDSTGLAIHDVALGFEAFRNAGRRKLGRSIALMH